MQIASGQPLPPAFAIPRTDLVADEMGLKPWLGDAGHEELLIYTLSFVVLVILVALDRGTLPEVSGEYISAPLTKGMREGDNTMDTLAYLMFGALIIGQR